MPSELVSEGADVLDVGGVKAGPGPEVSEAEELERVVPVIAVVRDRFDVPLSVDTWRASVAAEAFEAGAVARQRHQRIRRPRLPRRGRLGWRQRRRHPYPPCARVPDPEPHYDDVVAEVAGFLLERAERALASGIPPDRIILDAGLDLGKTAAAVAASSAALGHARLARLPVAAFLLEQDVSRSPARSRHRRARAMPPLASAALGIAGGCRLIRVHDVAGTCKVRDLLEAILESAPRR